MKIVAITEQNLDAIVEAASKYNDYPFVLTTKLNRDWVLSIIREEDERGRQAAYFAVDYITPRGAKTDTWAILPHDFAKSHYSGDIDSALEGWVEIVPSNTVLLNQE